MRSIWPAVGASTLKKNHIGIRKIYNGYIYNNSKSLDLSHRYYFYIKVLLESWSGRQCNEHKRMLTIIFPEWGGGRGGNVEVIISLKKILALCTSFMLQGYYTYKVLIVFLLSIHQVVEISVLPELIRSTTLKSNFSPQIPQSGGPMEAVPWRGGGSSRLRRVPRGSSTRSAPRWRSKHRSGLWRF